MAVVSLFLDTNMAAVTSYENTLYQIGLKGNVLFFRRGSCPLPPPSPLPVGVRGHAPPKNCKILHLQGCVLQYFEAAENVIQLPKKYQIKLIAHK